MINWIKFRKEADVLVLLFLDNYRSKDLLQRKTLLEPEAWCGVSSLHCVKVTSYRGWWQLM